MKTMKVFVVPSHQTLERTSGVDYVRVLSPMKYLNGYKDKDVKFEVDFYDIHAEKQQSWPEIAKKYDLIFLNYTVLDWQYATMGACVHGENKKIIMDLDDAIWYVSPDNIVHDKLQELNADFILTCILNDVDGVVTTNRYLRNIIADKTTKSHENIKVMENTIDLDHYTHRSKAKDTGLITLMHYGSTSHFNDLLDKNFVEGVDMVMRQYPNVQFKTVGSFIAELKNKWSYRYINDFGDVDIYKWIHDKFPSFMDEADIMVVPLIDNKYNRAKSDIKYLEIASAGKPGVFSNTRPYSDTIIHGENGYLAESSQDWYTSLCELIESKEKREAVGMKAYADIVDHRLVQHVIKDYADYFKRVVYNI